MRCIANVRVRGRMYVVLCLLTDYAMISGESTLEKIIDFFVRKYISNILETSPCNKFHTW